LASAFTDHNLKKKIERQKEKPLTVGTFIYLHWKNISVSAISPGLLDMEVEREARGKSPKKLL
jgi:hypothetical protein